MTPAERGRLGGIATLQRYGVEHYRRIGQKGQRVFRQRYRLVPWGMNDFAIVERASGRIIKTLLGEGLDAGLRIKAG
jgi:hypothetical protein